MPRRPDSVKCAPPGKKQTLLNLWGKERATQRKTCFEQRAVFVERGKLTDNSSLVFGATAVNSTILVFATSLRVKSHSGGFCNTRASISVEMHVTISLAGPGMGG